MLNSFLNADLREGKKEILQTLDATASLHLFNSAAMHRHGSGIAQRKDDSELKQISLLVDERSIPSKMVMRRKSEFRIADKNAEAHKKAYCKVYLCFIDCQQLRTFEFFRFLMYLNLSLRPFFPSRFPPRSLEIAFIIPFQCVSKRKSDFEYCFIKTCYENS